MATTANYTNSPLFDYAQVTAANTNRDGTGTTVLLGSGVATGKQIRRVTITAPNTTTAGMVRIYISKDTGTTKRLLVEIPVTAFTVSATQKGFTAEATSLVGLILPDTSTQLYGSTHNAETFNIFIESGSF